MSAALDRTTDHTPGPWHVDPDPRPGMEWNNHIYGADGMAVCFMAHSDGKDDERDEANARLISAAPELLAACKELMSAIERNLPMPDSRIMSDSPMGRARVAIHKAIGI